MPYLCDYLSCHNLATYHGYCSEAHMKRAKEVEPLMKIIKEVPGVRSIGEARKYQASLLTSQAPSAPSDPVTSKKRISEKDQR